MRSLPWNLTAMKEQRNGRKVFSCFHCGGGSTMGYKLAGFDMLGGVEIDPEMMAIYRANHNPRHSYLMGVQQFNRIANDQIPKELFDLDILDGSPPCSSFSMAGSREKKWGVKSHFREGQAEQVLDDLFFHFIETARKLQPKVVIAENVKGLILGKAKGYVKQINQMFNLAGYDLQLFLLNSAAMGVPQARERTFFIARRKGLNLPKLVLKFQGMPVTVGEALEGCATNGRPLSDESKRIWQSLKPGQRFSDVRAGSRFNDWILPWDGVAGTITANGTICHPKEPRHLSAQEYCRMQSFPDDFNFMNQKPQYVCGMSVPPFMMASVADEIHRQWFSTMEQPNA